MQIFYITDNIALVSYVTLRWLHKTMKKLNSTSDNDTKQLFKISFVSPKNKQKSPGLQALINTLDLYRALEGANYLE